MLSIGLHQSNTSAIHRQHEEHILVARFVAAREKMQSIQQRSGPGREIIKCPCFQKFPVYIFTSSRVLFNISFPSVPMPTALDSQRRLVYVPQAPISPPTHKEANVPSSVANLLKWAAVHLSKNAPVIPGRTAPSQQHRRRLTSRRSAPQSMLHSTEIFENRVVLSANPFSPQAPLNSGLLQTAATQPITASIPSFARAPGQSVSLGLSNAGLPVQVSTAGDVVSLSLQVLYSPQLLQITAAQPGSSLPADWTLSTTHDSDGHLSVSLSGSTPLASGTIDAIQLTASIPATASWLESGSIIVQGTAGTLTGEAQDLQPQSAVQHVRNLADLNTNGRIDSGDYLCITRLLTGASFASPNTPPEVLAVVADVNANGYLDASDAQAISTAITGGDSLIPEPIYYSCGSGNDPEMSVISGSGNAGETVDISVRLTAWTDATPADDVAAMEIFLRYDTELLDVAPDGVKLSQDLLDDRYVFVSPPIVDEPAGFIRTFISASAPLDPIDFQQLVDLLVVSFTITPSVSDGVAFINITQDPDGFSIFYNSNGFPLTSTVVGGQIVIGDGGGGGGGNLLANDDPDFGDPGFTGNEDEPFNTGSVLANDFDPAGLPLSIFFFSPPQRGPEPMGTLAELPGGRFRFDPNGQFDYLQAGQQEFVSFDYIINNTANEYSAPAVVTLTIVGVNDPPTISDIPNQSINEDSTLQGISTVVADPDSPNFGDTYIVSSNTTLFPDGSMSVTGSGNNRFISLNPAPNQFGTATITLTVSDGSAETSKSFNVVVNPVNDPPQISSINGQSTNEDTPVLNIPFSIVDVDSSSLIISVGSNDPELLPASGFSLGGFGTNRLLSINPAANRSGQATVTVTVSDGQASSSTVFDIFVNAVNDPPTISTIADQSTNEDLPLNGIAFTVNDIDNEFGVEVSSSDALLFPPGSLTISGSGTNRQLALAPATNRFGSALITVTVNDGQASASTTFLVNVAALNDTPTVSPIANQTISEDQALSGLPISVADVEGDPLTVTVDSSNNTLLPAGSLVLSGSGSNRQLTVTPAPGLSGTATITVSVTDGNSSNSSSFLLTVNPINDPPIISSFSEQNISEDQSLSGIPFTISDEDSPQLTVSVSSTNPELLPANALSITGFGSNRQLFVIPAANRFGTAIVTVTVSDGATSAASSFNLNVSSVNDSPVAGSDTAITRTETPVTISVLANDSDPDSSLNPASVEIVEQSANGNAIANPNGTITFTPAAGFVGTAAFKYRVKDVEGLPTADTSVVVTVSSNAAPVIVQIPDQSMFVAGAEQLLPLSISDADGDSLNISVSASEPTLLAALSVVGTGSSRSLRMVAGNRPGVSLITVVASDGVNPPVEMSFTVSVSLIVDAGASRPSVGVLTHRGFANSAAVTFSTNLSVAGTPANVPPSLFRTNVFDAPGGVPLQFNFPTLPGQAYVVDLFFAEVWTGAFGVGRRVFDVNIEQQLAISKLDVFAAAGARTALTRSFEVIGDGNLSIDFRQVVQNPSISGIRIRPQGSPNTPPTISAIAPQQTNEDTVISDIPFTIADAEGQPLTVTVSSADPQLLPAAGLVISGTGSNRSLSIQPANDRFGTTQVTLSVSDGAATTTRTFTVDVFSVNDAPNTVSDSAETLSNTPVTIPVLANDTDSDGSLNPATVVITSQSPSGTATANPNGTVTFNPATGFNGLASFTYTVLDNNGLVSAPAEVTVNVRSNAPPVISPMNDLELNATTVSAAIPFLVTDADQDSLTITATAGDSAIVSAVTLSGSGSNRTLTVTAGATAGETFVTITVSDGINPPVSSSFSVLVFTLIDTGSNPIAGSLADRAFQNGAGLNFTGRTPVTTAPGSIAASVPEQLYRSTLFDPADNRQLGFDIGAKAGQRFVVDLFFAEVWSGAFARGRRVFDVVLDGGKVLDDFDIFKEAGGGNIGIARRFEIESDGIIDLDFLSGIQNPCISGIRISPRRNDT